MKKALELLHERYHQAPRLAFDPLHLLDRSLPFPDQEIVAFILAGLAYGRVEQIQKSARDLFTRLELGGVGKGGRDLHRLIQEDSFHDDLRVHLQGWKHRLNTEDDLLALFQILKVVTRQQGSLKSLMSLGKKESVEGTLSEFCRRLSSLEVAKRNRAQRGGWSGTGPQWFFASPEDGSSCKRLMLWLRWMVRESEIDPGTWHRLQGPMPLQSCDLFIPLDTHILKWALKNKIVHRANPSWKSVVEISGYLRTLEPSDPLKYDFAIFQDSFERFREPRKPKKKIKVRSSVR
jgi:uncharacterized protein (TIGR02757 family)